MTTAHLPIDHFLTAAEVAAPAFGLDVSQIEPMSHSENVVLAVTARTGDRFAMRLHRPGYNSLEEMESEVAFVESLGRFGVPVPQPLPALSGGHYVGVDVGGIAHQVGVISWVKGEPLGGPLAGGGPGIVSHYQHIGQLAAQIRAHNAAWTAPGGFTRRRWDADGLVGDAPIWDRFWEADSLTDAQRVLFMSARHHLVGVLGTLPTESEHFGLIHADLHLGNVMASGDDLTLIDFDDCGHGWFIHELAVALHPMLGEPEEQACREAMVAGYRSIHEFSAEEESMIDAFLAMRSLMIIGWLAARPEVPMYAEFDDLAIQIEEHITAFMGSAMQGR